MARSKLKNRIDRNGILAVAGEELGSARNCLAGGMPSEGMRRRRRRQAVALSGAAVAGAAVAYLLDPQMGRSRRARLRDRALGAGRQVGRRSARLGRRVASDAEGMVERARYGEPDAPPPNDVTLARKVESEVLGRPDLPRGGVVVNAEHGVVTLRDEVQTPEQKKKLEKETRRVSGVRDVESLLHLPGQPAPNKEPSIRRGA